MKNITVLISLIFINFLYGQTGPGGIGTTDGTSNLVLWLNANTITATSGTTITNWNDKSGYGFDFNAGNGAIFNATAVNNYPAMHFNGTSHYFQTAYSATLNPSEFTVFSTTNVTSSTKYKAVISSRDDSTGTPTEGYILYARPTSNYWQFWNGKITGGWNVTTGNTATAGNWAQQMLSYAEIGINNKKLFINGALDAQNTYILKKNTTRPLRVGAGRNESTANYFFKGDIGEIIMYDVVLNEAERIIVGNYLAAKYAYSLNGNDFYTQDNTANGDFDHNVAGIGQAANGTNHTDSKGTGIVQINTPSSLANDTFLFWGEETKNPTYNFSTTATYVERLNSKWRISKRNDLGTVSVSVNKSDLTFLSANGCNELKLIVSSDASFATKTTYNMTFSGGKYTADLVSFTDGDYFTFEYIDKIVVDGTRFYNGSGFANVPNTTDGCYKLLVKSTANGLLPLTQGCNVREVEVEANGLLVVNSGLRLTVAGSVKMNGDIRLLGTSQLIQTHTGTSLVTGTGKLYIDRKGALTNIYQSGYWTSPVTTTGNTYTIANAMKDGTIPTSISSTPPNINFVTGYDGATTTPISISKYWLAKLVDDVEWDRHGNENTTYNPAIGYNMKSSGANGQNYTFVGKPNDGNYSVTVTGGKSTLLGNPYPSALDGDVFLLNNTGVISTLYFWDGTNDNSNSHIRNSYLGGYATRAIGIGTAYNGGATPERYIPVAQGFFIDAIVNGTIQFKNSQRRFNTSAPFYSKDDAPFPILRLGFDFNIDATNTFHRQLAVGFRGLTNNYDEGYDAIMYDMRPTDIALKVNNNTNDFVITGIEDFVETITIPLHVVLDQQRNVTFRVDAIENFTPNTVYLKDTSTNMYYNLTSDVVLNLPAGNYTDRFKITFRQGTAAIADYVSEHDIFIVDTIDNLTINSKSDTVITNVQVFNVIGQKLEDLKTKQTQVTMPVKLQKGQVLMIKITLENGQTIIKKLLKK